MRILITGGAGFIGTNAALRFIEKGHEVAVLDNLSRKGSEQNLAVLKEKAKDSIEFLRGDVRNALDVQEALAAKNYDAVLHLAAQVAVTTSVTDPRTDFDINALGTFNVLEAARRAKTQPAILYASTNKVYGGLDHLPVTEEGTRYVFQGSITGVDENCPLDFHSPYGCSKGAADQYVHDYGRIYALRTLVFRQSCIYGQYQMGVEDQGWVAWFIIAALLGRPVKVYGNGKQVRDLLHVDDLVSLYEAVLGRLNTVKGQVYNVGGGERNTLSLLEFHEYLKKDLGFDLKFSHGDVRPGDQPIFISNNQKAFKECGWQPTVEVKSGIKALKQWLQDNKSQWGQFYK